MLDLNAPIFPGVSAAGFHIGRFIESNGTMAAMFVSGPILTPPCSIIRWSSLSLPF
jgi:hypothetical protein